MKIFIADAFTDTCFGGNPAGVALLPPGEAFPGDLWMQALAAELKHSETAFIRQETDGSFTLRYFTPAGEVDLCGHATIASFTVLKNEGLLTAASRYTAHTKAGDLTIGVQKNTILMTMAPPVTLRTFDLNNAGDAALIHSFYAAFGTDIHAMPAHMKPEIISTGLPDIILPVSSRDILNALTPDFDQICQISESLDVVGFHVFAPGSSPEITAECRNFAPRYAINEEAATGTSNGALTWYLYKHGTITDSQTNTFLQGEAMGRPSRINSVITSQSGICVGGSAVILFGGEYRKEYIK